MLAERLFGHQYMVGMRHPEVQRSTEWVARLPAVVVARLTGKKPADAIKAKSDAKQPATPARRPDGLSEEKVDSDAGVRYLNQSGELEGGRRCATGHVWSLKGYRLGRSVTKPGEPTLYYLTPDQDGPARGFVWEELLIGPRDTVLPPDGVLTR